MKTTLMSGWLCRSSVASCAPLMFGITTSVTIRAMWPVWLLAISSASAPLPADDHWPCQLALFDIAHIGTLHSFCLRLVREHFHELGLDPQLAILDEGEARQ